MFIRVDNGHNTQVNDDTVSGKSNVLCCHRTR